ncbi:MAG TPA: hypothetical protein VNS81_05685 [Nocardioides sp.]|nr:hypothetical protein [Nocardioides sp.]
MTNESDVPPRLTPDQMPPVVDQASLEYAWRSLMGDLGFDFPQLWLLFLEDGHCGPMLAIDEAPLVPDARDLDSIKALLGPLVDRGRQVAFLFARPGRGRTTGDLAWARGLAALFPDGWPVHLANDVELRVAAPDDLAVAG